MVRVRLEGLPEEVHRIADAMQAAGCVLERSREYPNRGESRYVRVYLDCDLPEGCDDGHRRRKKTVERLQNSRPTG